VQCGQDVFRTPETDQLKEAPSCNFT
jgi:hypothetical protein